MGDQAPPWIELLWSVVVDGCALAFALLVFVRALAAFLDAVRRFR